MPTYTITNYSDTEVQLTVDGAGILYKKVYCFTEIGGNNLYFYAQQVETNAYRQQYVIPYTDVTDPVATSAADLKAKVDFIIQSYALYTDLVLVEVKNTSGGPLTKGTPVYITGTVGATDVLTIAAADASNSAKMPATGLLYGDLANNEFGHVIVTGLLTGITTDPIDGLTPTVNQTVYVKAGGGLTLTKPTGTNLIQNVGKVGRVNSGGAGSIAVANIQRSNDIPNLAQNNLWIGNASGVPTATTLSGDVTNIAGAVTIANDAVTFAKFQNINTDRLLGRDTAGSGDMEELTVGGGIEFTGTGIQTSAFTGDVTKSAGGTATSISNKAVTYAKIQDISSDSRLIGRGSAGGAGAPQEITLGSGLTMTGTTLSATGGGTSYTFSTGLTESAGTVTNNLSTGITGGQSVVGGTSASNNLTLSSTSNATKGKILFGTSAYDEVNNRLGIGILNPNHQIHVDVSSGTLAGTQQRFTSNTNILGGIIYCPSNTFSYGTYAANQINIIGGSGGPALRTNNSAPIRFYSGSSDYDTSPVSFQLFASTGNVFIGSSPTDAGYKLNVNGSVNATSTYPTYRGVSTSAANSAGIQCITNNGTGNFCAFQAYGNTVGFGLGSNAGFGSSSSIVILGNGASASGGTTTIKLRPGGFDTTADALVAYQNAVSIGTTNIPDASAVLDIVSGGNNKGVLVPRLSSAQRNAIVTPAAGLVLYQTTNNVLSFRDATTWNDVVSTSNYDGMNISFGTTTGSKIATGTTQKLGFWNATPIAQPTTAVASATRVGGGGTTLTDTDTFDGYTLAQVVKALRNAGLLA